MTSPEGPPPVGGGSNSGPSEMGPWTASLSGLDMLVNAALGTQGSGDQTNVSHPVGEYQSLPSQPPQPVHPAPVPQEPLQPANAVMNHEPEFQPPNELPFQYIQQAIDTAFERHRVRTVSQQPTHHQHQQHHQHHQHHQHQQHQQVQAPHTAPNQHLGHPAHYHAGSQMPCFSPACIGNPDVGWIFSTPGQSQQGQQAAAVPGPSQSAHHGQNFSHEQTQMSAYEPMFTQPPGNYTYPNTYYSGMYGGQPPTPPMGYPMASPYQPTVPMATGPYNSPPAASLTPPAAANQASASTATASERSMPPPAISNGRKPSASRPPRSRKRSQKENAPKYAERMRDVGLPTSSLSADSIAAGLAWRHGHDTQTPPSSDTTSGPGLTQDPVAVNSQHSTTATSLAPPPAPTDVKGVRMTVNSNPTQYRVTSRVADHISNRGFIHDGRRLPLSGMAPPPAPAARVPIPTLLYGQPAHMGTVNAPAPVPHHVNFSDPFAPVPGGPQVSAEPQLPAFMNGPRQSAVAPVAPFTSPAGTQSATETPGRRQSKRANKGKSSAEKSKRTTSDMENDGSDESPQSPSARAAKRRKSGSANGSGRRRT